MAKHSLSRSSELFFGDAYFAPAFGTNEKVGVPITPIYKVDLGSPIAADVDYIMDAATSTELPNTETVTYTTADDGTSPFDNADTPAVSSITTATGATASVWALDVPRNISVNVTHGSSIVAMTVVVTGYDFYKVAVSETFTVTATGTTKTVAGKKAFAYVESIALTAAADAEANTCNIGTGDVLGLPYAIGAGSDVMGTYFNEAFEATAATIVAADANTATATTGDVRGTIDPNSACDGSTVFVYMAPDPSTKASLFGVDQYGG